MGASVEYEFKKGFILDEERIRKINDLIIGKAHIKSKGITPNYQIYFENSFTFKSNKIQEIFELPNNNVDKITRIKISLNNKNLDLIIDFDIEKSVMQIEGENRDLVFVLFSDLRDYLNKEVFTVWSKKIKKGYLRTIIPFLSFILMIYVFYHFMDTTTNINKTELSKIINNNEIIPKINYLLEERLKSPTQFSEFFKWVLPLGFLALISEIFPITDYLFEKPFRYLFPSNLFLIGKAIQENDKRKNFLDKILWGVLIALVISITGAIIYSGVFAKL